MKFQHLAPVWHKKLQDFKFPYINQLRSFNTCIIGEITKKYNLPVFTESYMREEERIEIKIPKCFDCWSLGVRCSLTINPKAWEYKPSEIRTNIKLFYESIVPKIEAHFEEKHHNE